jgi:uncharacterized RDD family membrane protein YckC/Tfp pilus assembly major pilin PilA
LIFCPECGTKAADTQKFCVKCGTALPGVSTTATPPPQTEPPKRTVEPPPLPNSPPPPPASSAPQPATPVYASFGRRVVAFVIDYIIIVFGIALISAFATAGGNPAQRSGNNFVPLLTLLFVWLYKAGMESSPLQATLGKLALGIKVTTLTGERSSFWRATGRTFAQLLSAIILYIGYLMAGFTKRRQALHDMIAGTLVVRKQYAPSEIENSPPAPAGEDVVAVILIVFGGIALIGILAAIAIPAYQDYTIRAQVTEGLELASPYKAAVAEALARGDSPIDIDSDSLQLGVRDGHHVQSVQVHSAAIVITYGREANARIQGRHLTLYAAVSASRDIVWVCGHAQPPAPIPGGGEEVVGTTDVEDKYLPSACRASGGK